MFGIHSNIHARVMRHLTCWCSKVTVSIRHISSLQQVELQEYTSSICSLLCVSDCSRSWQSSSAGSVLSGPGLGLVLAEATEALLELPGARATSPPLSPPESPSPTWLVQSPLSPSPPHHFHSSCSWTSLQLELFHRRSLDGGGAASLSNSKDSPVRSCRVFSRQPCGIPRMHC